jgi:hypothetical protein
MIETVGHRNQKKRFSFVGNQASGILEHLIRIQTGSLK